MFGAIINGLVRISLHAILLLLLMLLALKHLIDPNYYKPQLIALVEQQLQYQLQINGDIKLKFFPWLGVELHEVVMYDGAEFVQQPLVKLAYMRLRLRLLALIKGEIELAKIGLIGLDLELKSANLPLSSDDSKPETKKYFNAWQIAGIDIEAANLAFNDGQYNYQLQELSLVTDKLTHTDLTQIKLHSKLVITDIKTLNVLYSSPIKLSIPLIKLPQLYIPLHIPQINLQTNCLHLEFTDISITEFNTVQAQVKSTNFNLKQCLAQFELDDLINITTIQFSSQLQATKQSLKFSSINLIFDATKINGDLSIIDIMDNLRINLNLLIDKLNLDKYLPATDNNNDSPILPLDWLKNLPLTGTIQIHELDFAEIKLHGLRLTLE